MNWSDFVIKANDILQREFKVKEADGSVQIYEYDPKDQQDRVIFQTKRILRKKLTWLFPFWENTNHVFDSKTITKSEEKLFVYLLEKFPEYKFIGKSKEAIKTFYWLDQDIWEVIPIAERKKLLRLVKALDDISFCRYMMVEKREDAQSSFDRLKAKLLFPQYYRLLQNVFHLESILSNEKEILSEKGKKEKIILFEKEFNDLLIKHEQLTDGFIFPYPRTVHKIDEMIDKNKTISTQVVNSQEDFLHLIEDAIK